MSWAKLPVKTKPRKEVPPEKEARRDLERTFAKFGRVEEIWVSRQPPGFAFVTFDTYKDALNAVDELDGHKFQGKSLNIQLSTGKSGGGGGGKGGGGGRDSRGGGGRRSSRSPRRRSRSRSRRRSPSRSEKKASGKKESDKGKKRGRSPSKSKSPSRNRASPSYGRR
ncbi:unnamed protein product [Polarella glacialis]|uniref:RRM domain-containing protein n=1 Tax=Polarella glacialis TaxID=89957 RepID=A0A813H848_POLGL|nr:unnamed protein product [Polarella glacialis]